MSDTIDTIDTENIYQNIGGIEIPILKKNPKSKKSKLKKIPELKGGGNGGALFYEDINFKGKVTELGPGRYKRVNNHGITNDTISSIKPNGLIVTIYLDDNLSGDSLTVTRPINDLRNRMINSSLNWNDEVSSVEITVACKRKAQFFKDCNFKGAKICLGPGSYTLQDLKKKGLNNDSLSSIRPNGLKIMLYEHNNYKGKTLGITTDVSCLKDFLINFNQSWNDQVSSIEII